MRFFKKCLIFLLANAIVMGFMSLCFETPYVMETYVEEYREGDYNTAILGQSCAVVGLDPHLMDTEEDKVYNFARGGMNIYHIYELLRMLGEDGSLHRVYFSFDDSYWSTDTYLRDVIGGYDSEAVYLTEHAMAGLESPGYVTGQMMHQEAANFLFPYKVNKKAIVRIPYLLKAKLSPQGQPHTEAEFTERYLKLFPDITEAYVYQGRGFSRGIKRNVPDVSEFETGLVTDTAPDPVKVFDSRFVAGSSRESFEKIAAYCREREIELIGVIPPQAPVTLWKEDFGEFHDYIAQLCMELGIPLYDMNYVKFQYLPRSIEDYVDPHGHVMGDLADRQTRLLMELVSAEDPEDWFETSYDAVLSGITAYGRALASGT